MSRAFDSLSSEGVGTPRFRPAAAAGKPSGQPAGPFDIAPAKEQDGGFASLAVTGLLVICPVFATVAAIVVGLALSGGGT